MIPKVSTKELAKHIKLQCNKFMLEQHNIRKLLSKSKEIDNKIEEAKNYLNYVEEQRNIEQIEITQTEIDNLTNKKIELEKRYYNSKIYIKLKKMYDESNETEMNKLYIHSNIDWDEKLKLPVNAMSKIKSKNPKINRQDIPWIADFFGISVEELTFGNFENYVKLCFETPTFDNDSKKASLLTNEQLEIVIQSAKEKGYSFGDFNKIYKLAVNKHRFLPKITDDTDMKKVVKKYGENILFQIADEIVFNLHNERLKKLVPLTNALMKVSNHKYTDRQFLLRTTAEYLYLIISHQEEEKKLTFYQIQRVNMMLIQFMFTEMKKIMKTQSKDDSKYAKKEKTVTIVTKFFSIMQIKRLLNRRKR